MLSKKLNLVPTSSQQSDTAPTKAGLLVSVQALRGIAALLVVLFHLHLLGPGFAGVDIFFVLSGVIMGTVGIHERPGVFIRRRLARIVPLYWLVTLAMCIMSLVPGLMRNFQFDTVSLLKSLMFIPYRDAHGDILPLVAPGWTLTYEMLFYMIFAALLPSGRVREWVLALLVVLGSVGTVNAFHNPLLITCTSPLLFEFSGGILLSLFNPVRGVVAVWVAVSGEGAELAVSGRGARPGHARGRRVNGGAAARGEGAARAAQLGGSAFAVVAGAVAIERAGGWPHLPGAQMLGDASYSLYLTHGLIIAATSMVVHRLGGGKVLEVSVGLSASVMAALIVYRWFERPITRLLR